MAKSADMVTLQQKGRCDMIQRVVQKRSYISSQTMRKESTAENTTTGTNGFTDVT